MSAITGNRTPPVTITVTAADRTIEADVPGQMPLTVVVPTLARKLGVLDSAIVHGGYRLLDPHGSAMPLDQTFADLGVRDGAHFTLEVSLLAPSLVEYDDIVEAVGDVVAREVEPWSPNDGAMTASVVSTGILLVAAVSLAVMSSTPVLGYATLGAAVLVLAMTGALAIRDRPAPALLAGAASVVFAGVGGYHLVRGTWPETNYAEAMLGVGIAVAVWGAAGLLVLRSRRIYAAGPIGAGVVLAAVGGISWLEPTWAQGAWSMAMGLIAVLAGLLPWVALTTARLVVDTPQSDIEIFKVPEAIDSEAVERRFRRGNEWLVAARVAALAVVACAAPVVSALSTPAGLILCAEVLAGMMLSTRSIVGRRDVLLVMVGTAIGIVGAVLGATGAHPTWRPVIAVVLAAGAVGVVGFTLVAGARSLRATRIADTLESMCLVAVLPTAVIAAGIVGG